MKTKTIVFTRRDVAREDAKSKVVNGITYYWSEHLNKWVTVPEDEEDGAAMEWSKHKNDGYGDNVIKKYETPNMGIKNGKFYGNAGGFQTRLCNSQSEAENIANQIARAN